MRKTNLKLIKKKEVKIVIKMDTFAELENGVLIKYYITDNFEDEFGRYRDNQFDWKNQVNKIEKEHNKKVISSIAKVSKEKIIVEEFSKGKKEKVYTKTIITLKERFFKYPIKQTLDYFEKQSFFYGSKPGLQLKYFKGFEEDFGDLHENC